MKYRIMLIVVFVCGTLLISQSAPAHCTQWNELYEKVITLNHQGQTDQAIILANRVVTVAENRFGTDHPYVAVSLNVLAQLYSEKNQYDMADSSYKRALGIYEQSLGPASLSVAQILTEMSDLYLAANKSEEAFSCLSRAQDIYRVAYRAKPVEALP